jgi:glycosyltransferase involved in cell wall biosynthesis
MSDAGINSMAWWDNNFSSAWEANAGRQQTRHFMERLIANLPESELEFLRTTAITILDWGCALGDGADALARAFPACRIIGLDFSRIAIEQARRSFPYLEFKTTEQGGVTEAVDVLICSNCLEHFDAPLEVLRSQIAKCRQLYVALVPLDERVLIECHRSRFHEDSFPAEVAGFRRLHCYSIEVNQRLWGGKQLLAVYGSPDYCKDRTFRMAPVAERLHADLLAARQEEERLREAHQEDCRRMEERYGCLKAELDALRASRMVRGVTAINRTLGRLRRLPQPCFAEWLALLKSFHRTIRNEGVSHAMALAARHVRRNTSKPQSVAFSNQDRYVHEQSAQSSYLNNYLSTGVDSHDYECWNSFFSSRSSESAKILLYPLSYPLELTQRPDHVLRSFAEHGYRCIIVSVDDTPPYVRELSAGVYLTNLFAATISHYSDRDVCLYVTYPFHNYISQCLRKAIVIYDVLDDLSVFSLNCEAMRGDHAALLENSDMVIFSSQALLDANAKRVKHLSCLVTNGVWVDDFRPEDVNVAQYEIPRQAGEFIIGYHGVISDLLDWRLLEAIIAIPTVRLVLLGPVAQFADTPNDDAIKAQQLVMSSPQVTHIPTVPYKHLKHYLSKFNAGIIPFVVNAKTNPVSPLKLFEYMAVGIKIFATPTKTLLEYSDYITVVERSELPGKLREFLNQRSVGSSFDYTAILEKADWGKQLAPVRANTDLLLGNGRCEHSKAKRVDLLNVNFFDWDGNTRYKGGAERYVYDLAQLFKREGWSPRDFMGIPVIGVPTGCGHDMRGMSKGFSDISKGADLIVASPLDLACELRGRNVLGINHGIYWDHKYKSLSTTNIKEYRNIFDSLKTVHSCVCVDTNFMNWVRTYDYRMGKKLRYVPNYFDANEFYPVEKSFSGRITALYPRRLYEARGCFITLQAFDYLLGKYQDLDLHLVGQANHEDGLVVSQFIKKFPDRVVWEELEMNDMPQVYRASHIVLIPTMYSEGTSLSCLEAMATNNAIVASNIGGLPNLVVDAFNGFLIDPDVPALVGAVEALLKDRAKMRAMASAGLHLAPVFEKAKWTEQWRSLIKKCVNCQ